MKKLSTKPLLCLLTTCLVISGAFSTLLAKDPTWFVDQNYVYQHGSALSKRYLEERHPDCMDQLEKNMQWVVRIEVQHSFNKQGYSSNHGTGVILKGGKIITAKHTLTQGIAEPDKVKILLTTVEGKVFPAKLEQLGEKDWMVLQMENTEQHPIILDSTIEIAAPTQDEVSIFLGYPARLGLDAQGQVQSFHIGDTNQNIPVSKLKPMVVVTAVTDISSMALSPLAGFPAVGGMSGGPIFNLKGQVIAVQHSISKTTSDQTGEVLNYTFDATSTNDIKMK